MAQRIAIASDYAAFEMKDGLLAWLRGAGHAVLDLGPHGSGSVDYPDYGYSLAAAIADGRADLGVALCGPGIGIAAAKDCLAAFIATPYAGGRHALRVAKLSEPRFAPSTLESEPA